MQRVALDTVQGCVVDQPGPTSIQFSDRSGNEWEIEVADLDLFALKELLARICAQKGIAPQSLTAAARQKYSHLFDFPDS